MFRKRADIQTNNYIYNNFGSTSARNVLRILSGSDSSEATWKKVSTLLPVYGRTVHGRHRKMVSKCMWYICGTRFVAAGKGFCYFTTSIGDPDLVVSHAKYQNPYRIYSEQIGTNESPHLNYHRIKFNPSQQCRRLESAAILRPFRRPVQAAIPGSHAMKRDVWDPQFQVHLFIRPC